MTEGTAARRGRGTPQDVDRHVGARMRERRLLLGLTQQQVAGRIGTTYQQAYKYESGANRISAGLLHLIAEALGVEPAYFFEGLEAGPLPGPTTRERAVLGLARDFLALPSRRHQEAVADVARVLAEL